MNVPISLPMSVPMSDDVLHHLLIDYLWKAGIVAALAVLAVKAMVVIWRRS